MLKSIDSLAKGVPRTVAAESVRVLARSGRIGGFRLIEELAVAYPRLIRLGASVLGVLMVVGVEGTYHTLGIALSEGQMTAAMPALAVTLCLLFGASIASAKAMAFALAMLALQLRGLVRLVARVHDELRDLRKSQQAVRPADTPPFSRGRDYLRGLVPDWTWLTRHGVN